MDSPQVSGDAKSSSVGDASGAARSAAHEDAKQQASTQGPAVGILDIEEHVVRVFGDDDIRKVGVESQIHCVLR